MPRRYQGALPLWSATREPGAGGYYLTRNDIAEVLRAAAAGAAVDGDAEANKRWRACARRVENREGPSERFRTRGCLPW